MTSATRSWREYLGAWMRMQCRQSWKRRVDSLVDVPHFTRPARSNLHIPCTHCHLAACPTLPSNISRILSCIRCWVGAKKSGRATHRAHVALIAVLWWYTLLWKPGWYHRSQGWKKMAKLPFVKISRLEAYVLMWLNWFNKNGLITLFQKTLLA